MHVVARIGRAHGLRGEVTVQLHTDAPEQRFRPGTAFGTDPDRGTLVLQGVRTHQGRHLLTFDGITDRGAAEGLRDTRLLVTAQDTPEEQDAWYPEDLVGLQVVLVDGTPVGTVSALHTRPVQDLLEIRLATGGRALVPFVADLVPEVDQPARRVVIDPPAGLLDLAE